MYYVWSVGAREGAMWMAVVSMVGVPCECGKGDPWWGCHVIDIHGGGAMQLGRSMVGVPCDQYPWWGCHVMVGDIHGGGAM